MKLDASEFLLLLHKTFCLLLLLFSFINAVCVSLLLFLLFCFTPRKLEEDGS